MTRCTSAHVDLRALEGNFRLIGAYLAGARARLGLPPPGIIAVVKANAYGHGAARVGLALEHAGATMLACADIEEGIELRRSGVRTDILVFGALSVSDVSGLFEHRLTPTASTPAAGRALQAAAAARATRLRYHLKIDTGMNRLGFRHDNLDRTLAELLSSPNLVLAAVATHFATADDPASPLFEAQRLRFEAAVARVEALGAPKVARHAANSAAILRDERVWYDFVRPGALLYGLVPPPLTSTLALEPVMTIRSRIVSVKGVHAGESVGYGARFVAARPSRIAIVPAGYADGLDVGLGGQGAVLVRGRRVPIVGAVSMDMLAIDVTGLAVETGDEVVLLGRQGGDEITVREMAAAAGTVPYEVLCRVGTRIERIYDAAE